LSTLEDRYIPDVRNAYCSTLSYLSQAYSIAKSNIDEDSGENYLEQFYQGVKGMLDTRPDDLGRWAKSVCDEFKKQGEGLLRWAV